MLKNLFDTALDRWPAQGQVSGDLAVRQSVGHELQVSLEVKLCDVLQMVTLRPGAYALLHQFDVGERGEHCDRGIGDGRPQLSTNIGAIQVGQTRIQQHHIRLSLFDLTGMKNHLGELRQAARGLSSTV